MYSLFTILITVPTVLAHATWCGKYYELDAPRTPPVQDTFFQCPQVSDGPLLDFRCHTASSIYLQDDLIWDPPQMIFDANITQDVGQPCENSSTPFMSYTNQNSSLSRWRRTGHPGGARWRNPSINLTRSRQNITPGPFTSSTSVTNARVSSTSVYCSFERSGL
jgi:hypothetical protein